MCHFLTSTLDESASIDRVQPILRANHLRFAQIHNRAVVCQLPHGRKYGTFGTSHCECGTVFGRSQLASREKGILDPETPAGRRKIQQYRSKGWSEAKIERWIQDKQLAQAKRSHDQVGHDQCSMQEADGWLTCLESLLATGACKVFGVLIHYYRTNPETERFSIEIAEPIPVHSITAKTILYAKEDVLYEFTK